MTDKPSIAEALSSVMAEVRAVRKNDRNGQQGYNFRGVDAVVNAVGPALRAHHVVVVPMLEEVHYRDVQTSTGKPSRECTVTVRYRFHGPAGDFLDCVTPGESMDFGDKGAPKAMSVAYRIALLQALCLPTTDTDPDSESFERAIGSGRPASSKNGSAPAATGKPVGPADAAKTVLRNRAKAMGLDLDAVAKEYEARAKTPLKDETRADWVEKFVAGLADGTIKVPAAAGAS